jgi:hypothetical protein
MGKLHELLAVESDLRATKDKAKADAISVFLGNSDNFTGYTKDTQMFDDDRSDENIVDARNVEFTVNEFLDATSRHLARYWDLRLQKETANQEAIGDVVVDGHVIYTGLPVTFLLNMEEELKQLRKVYESAPVLQGTLDWHKSDLLGKDIWKAEDNTKHKTEKAIKHRVLTEATQYFAAQIEKWSENKNVANIKITQFSGNISTTDKLTRLNKIDKLITAFKQARQRANCQETRPCEIGAGIFAYINS